MRRFTPILLVLSMVLMGCQTGPMTVDHILQEAKEADGEKRSLEMYLGPPNETSKFGPIETWIYKAKDGVVTFRISGDDFYLKSTKRTKKKKSRKKTRKKTSRSSS